jgi:hypothetical protein
MRHRSCVRAVLAWLWWTGALATSAHAQASEDKVEGLILKVLRAAASENQITARQRFGAAADVRGVGPIDVAFAINGLVGTQAVPFPLASSTGGFAFVFDAASGTFSRASDSFGPTFTERALTAGRGRLTVGATYQRASFDAIDKYGLDGDLVTVTEIVPAPSPTFFEDTLHLGLVTNTVGLLATFGVTDRLDVGITVPMVNLEMEVRVATELSIDGHLMPVGTRAPVRQSVTGLGDVLIRSKYAFWRAPRRGLALGADVRLPTGDEKNLLGALGAQGKLYIVASTEAGTFSPHVNVGATFSDRQVRNICIRDAVFGGVACFADQAPAPPGEFNYAGGVDIAVTPTLTVIADVIGRTLRQTDVLRERVLGTRTSFIGETGDLHVWLGGLGMKLNPRGKGLLSVNVLFPLNQRGLRDTLTIVLGGELSF